MSFFSWLSKKPIPVRDVFVPNGGAGHANRGAALSSAMAVPPSLQPAAQVGAARAVAPPSVERKVRRHARREQLYGAIRESMTRAGMLSATYRFKVLSLDQNGNQFLVMMDVAAELTTSPAKLSHTEEILTQTAKAGYGIIVTAVYWRFDPKSIAKPQEAAAAGVAAPAPASISTPASMPAPTSISTPASMLAPTSITASASTPAPALAPVPAIEIMSSTKTQADPFAITQANTKWVPETSRHDPLLEAEVAAFKRALAAAPPAARPVGLSAPAIAAPAASRAGNAASGPLTSYGLITGFEDTETPDATAVPALSPTQYGELN